MHVDLRDLVRVPDQLHELLLSHLQGRIRHHIQQADVQFADVLLQGRAQAQNFLAGFAQAFKGRQMGVFN